MFGVIQRRERCETSSVLPSEIEVLPREAMGDASELGVRLRHVGGEGCLAAHARFPQSNSTS